MKYTVNKMFKLKQHLFGGTDSHRDNGTNRPKKTPDEVVIRAQPASVHMQANKYILKRYIIKSVMMCAEKKNTYAVFEP